MMVTVSPRCQTRKSSKATSMPKGITSSDRKEIDDLKLEAKHTIDMVRFVDESEIESRYWEKPYYLTPDGDEADEGYTVIREALKQTRKVAIGQLIMGRRGHLVG